MSVSRARVFWLSLLGVTTLVLFFGLFFGLNYPEIVRHGWPVTRCRVLDARVDQRYCCELACSNCASAPQGAPSCGSSYLTCTVGYGGLQPEVTITSQIDRQFSPSACAANSSACPASAAGTCDNGYTCCGQCCSTCQSCTTSCSSDANGVSTCTQSCTTSECNCTCCSSTAHLSCSYSCPTCYNDILDISYMTYRGQTVNTTYRQDFGKDTDKSTLFLQQHAKGSVSACYYNPSNLNEIAYDVKFTTWKWVVSALFGMVPLLAIVLYLLVRFCALPFGRVVRTRMRERLVKSGSEPREEKRTLPRDNDDNGSLNPPP